jgi:transcriptional regulator with XRE-family HTH domain
MEFHEKLQELRKQKNITQEELAASLFVSRTAVSKWESGRGYPNIESLKALSKFYSVSIDELLSGDELLTIAEEDTRQRETRYCDLVFGLLDLSVTIFFFLPFFGQKADSIIQAVSLPAMTMAAPYLRLASYALVLGSVLTGVLTLALQNCRRPFWLRSKSGLSFFLSAAGTLLFILSMKPYAAALLFAFLLIKVFVTRNVSHR